MRKSILFASMAALIMSSCSSNEFDFGGSDAGSKLQVSASIHELQTRAHETSWDANDAIGVSDADKNTNVKYVTTSGDGDFTSDNVIYLLGNESHSFTAYYPYNESVSAENKTITFDEPADYMYGTASATRQNPKASFTFTHKMSELSFTVTDATSTNSSSAKAWTRAEGNETTGSGSSTASSTITLHDVVLNGTFDTSNGTVTPGDKKGDLTISFTPGQKSSFLLPPQSFEGGNVKISVNHNGKTFGGTLSLDETTEGNDIQYGLTINKENQQTALVIKSKTITGWTPVNKGNQDLAEKEAENVLEIGDFLLNDGSVVDKAYDLNKITATGKTVVGVVYYVGNPQPSVLYKNYEDKDILKAEAPGATHGLAIAINNGNAGKVARMFANSPKYDYSDWFTTDNETSKSYISTTMNTTKAGIQFLGYNNTAVIEKVGDKTDENPEGGETGSAEFTKILTDFRAANTVDNCSKWYLPSYAELKQIQENYAAISKSITIAKGSLQQFSDFTIDKTNPKDKTSDKFYWSSDLRGSSLAWISPLCETGVEEKNLYIARNTNDLKGYFRFAIAF